MATAVLALQGAFAEHERVLAELGEGYVELRSEDDLARPFERLVLPGGESTTQGRLLRERSLLGPLRERVLAGMPVLGTCAGLILLARQVLDEGSEGRGDVRPEGHLATLDMSVRRNAYGRQLGSFHAHAPLVGTAAADLPSGGRDPGRATGTAGGAVAARDDADLPLTFIRAPRIERVGPGVMTLIELDGTPVAVRQGAQLACSFHPELDGETRLHELLLSL